MCGEGQIKVAIVDYGLGNLFSVKHACTYAGMQATITSSVQEIWQVDVVILPGVGAYGDAMEALRRLDLVSPLREIAFSEKLLVGICLGMQLLMTESYEFGRYPGLGIIEGPVVRFKDPEESSRILKVPQVGWNQIFSPDYQFDQHSTNHKRMMVEKWADSPLKNLHEGDFMYFVHSFYARPENPDVVLSLSQYGHIEFCSSMKYGNVFASQFHPERSGPQGLRIYQNIASVVCEQRRS